MDYYYILLIIFIVSILINISNVLILQLSNRPFFSLRGFRLVYEGNRWVFRKKVSDITKYKIVILLAYAIAFAIIISFFLFIIQMGLDYNKILIIFFISSMISGSLLAVVGLVWGIIVSTKVHMGWGTALLLASVIAFPLFALKHMDNVKKAFRLWTIGILLLTLPFLRGPDVSYHFLENFKFYTGIPVI